MNLAEPEIDAEGRGDNFEEVVSSSSLSTAGGFQIGLRSSVFGLFFEHNLSVRVYDNCPHYINNANAPEVLA